MLWYIQFQVFGQFFQINLLIIIQNIGRQAYIEDAVRVHGLVLMNFTRNFCRAFLF